MNDKQLILQMQKDIKDLQEKVAKLTGLCQHEWVASPSPDGSMNYHGMARMVECRLCGKDG
jgi:hypothetical protein